MTNLHDLVYDWAYRNCPELLHDEQMFRCFFRFVFEIVEFSILAARRQAYRELQEPKVN